MDTLRLFLPALQPLFDLLWELFLTILLPGATGWIAVRIFKTLGINDDVKRAELDKRLRDALHAAALNALKMSLGSQAGASANDIARTLRLDNSPVVQAVNYVQSNNADAMKHFGLDANALVPIVLSKLPDVLQQIAPPTPAQ